MKYMPINHYETEKLQMIFDRAKNFARYRIKDSMYWETYASLVQKELDRRKENEV